MDANTGLDAAAVLASARASRAAANAHEARILADAVTWGRMHEVCDVEDAATWRAAGCGETGIALAGEGAPLVAEFCVPELAAALGLSPDAGRRLLAESLELAHRLPRVWARVQAGELAPWRARRIAEATLALSVEAAEHVDSQVAPFAHRVGPAQTQRLVEEAIARFMPEFARERRERAADGRHFDIEHGQVSFQGTSQVYGELDLADALDLEEAVARGAEHLRRLGSEQPLDVRRAEAVGDLARHQPALDLDNAQERGGGPQGAGDRQQSSPGRGSRRVELHVHLSEAAIRTGDPCASGRLEEGGDQLVTAGQVAAWCGLPTSRVTVKPVIDLAERVHVTSYEVPDRLRERVDLRDRTCVFPWCTRPARRCDADHVVPHEAGGPTSSENLAPLCRRHHRAKTHASWTYTVLEPGSYLWTSPYGYTYLRDHTGTQDLTEPPVPPPRAHPPDG